MDSINKNAEREGQPKSRQQGAWGKKHRAQSSGQNPGNSAPCALSEFQNLLRPLPCASGPDLSLQAGSSLKLPTGQFLNGRPFNRKEVYWQR